MIINSFNNTKLSHFLKYLTNMQNFTLMLLYATTPLQPTLMFLITFMYFCPFV